MNSTLNTTSVNLSGPWRIADWALRIVLGLAFIAAGGAKLGGALPMVEMFDQIGVGQWFRYVTGALEILGGILILFPRTIGWGALLLTCITIGAVLTHLAIIGGSAVPALVLLVLSAVVLWNYKRQLPFLA